MASALVIELPSHLPVRYRSSEELGHGTAAAGFARRPTFTPGPLRTGGGPFALRCVVNTPIGTICASVMNPTELVVAGRKGRVRHSRTSGMDRTNSPKKTRSY